MRLSVATPAERVLGDITEARFQRQVLELLKLRGWLTYHTHDSRRSNSGYPDITAVRRGRILFIELKTRKGRTSPMQETWLSELRHCSEGTVTVTVARPQDWDVLLRITR